MSHKRRSNHWDAGCIGRHLPTHLYTLRLLLPIAALFLLLFVILELISTSPQPHTVSSSYGRAARAALVLRPGRERSLEDEEDELGEAMAPSSGDDAGSRESMESKEPWCDLSKGTWVWDEGGPLYTNQTCSHIQGHTDCMKNGRPDRGYLHWRWKPDLCDLPRFDATKFFHLMRGKAMAFVGDSIARNQLHSLLCLLDQVGGEAEEIFHDQNYQTMTWSYPAHNFTLSAYWAPFLVKYAEGEKLEVHLDVLQPDWVRALPALDVVVLMTGPWFTKWATYFVKGAPVGCHGCSDQSSEEVRDVGIYAPLRAAIRSAVRGVTTLPGYTGLTLLQTWVSGHSVDGQCPFTQPITNVSGDGGLPPIERRMYETGVEEVGRMVRKEENGSRLRLLDVSNAAVGRGDGHPGPYTEAMKYTDCLHWCVPGPIDTMNEILLESMAHELHEQGRSL